MTEAEHGNRIWNMNAHFAWALVLWGSAEISRKRCNWLLAPIGFYYAAFHAGFALVNANHEVPASHLKRISHSRLQRYLKTMLAPQVMDDFQFLRGLREWINYLGSNTPSRKFRIVRGDPISLKIASSKFSYADALALASERSARFIEGVLVRIEEFGQTKTERWPHPIRGDVGWLDYLGEDVLFAIIPREMDGTAILQIAFELVDIPFPVDGT